MPLKTIPDAAPDFVPLASPDRDRLLRGIQETLAALADIDCRYESDRARLQEWTGSERLRRAFLERLDEQHERDRRPYALRLADLHQRMMNATLFEGRGLLH